MLRRLAIAWRLAAPRAAAHRLVVVLAAVTVLAATVLAVGGPMYAAAVAQAGLEERLASGTITETGLRINGIAAPSDVDAAHDQVVAAVAPLGVDRVEVVRTVRGPSLTAPVIDATREVLVVEETQDLAALVDVVEGALPAPDGGPNQGPIPVIVDVDLAARFDAEVGELLRATIKTSQQPTVLRVVGHYRSTTGREPRTAGEAFDTLTVLTAPGALSGVPTAVDVRWDVRLRPDRVAIGALTELSRSTPRVQDALRDIDEVTAVQTDLDTTLAAARRALSATRSAVRSVTATLALLALITVVLSARVLTELRETGVALLRARGASRRQLVAASALEAVLIVLPAAVLGIPLAWLLIAQADQVGSVAAAGIDLRPEVTGSSFGWTVAAVGVGWAGLTLPTATVSDSYAEAQRRRGRRLRRGWLQRWFVDVLLLALAALTLWQAGSSPVTDTALDPALVIAPPLVLIAGAVAGLRALPRLSRLLGVVGGRATRLDARLAAAQIGRRTHRYALPTIIALLAGGLAVYAATYARTWSQAQAERAALEVGADVRVDPARDEPRDPLATRDAYAALDGVGHVTPIHTLPITPARGRRGTVLAVGADGGSTLLLRSDRVVPPTSGVTALDVPPEIPALALPDEADAVRVSVSATGDLEDTLSLALVTRDDTGLLRRESHGLPLDGDPHELTFTATGGAGGQLLALELRTTAPAALTTAGMATVVVHDLAAEVDARPQPLPDPRWSTGPVELRRTAVAPTTELSGDAVFTLELSPGVSAESPQAVSWRVLPGSPAPPEPLPALLTFAAAEALQVAPGDTATLALPGFDVAIVVRGSTERLPTITDEPVAVAVDGAALTARRYLATGDITAPSSWLLAVDAGTHGAVARTIAAERGAGRRISTVTARTAEHLREPVRLGLSGSLELGGWAALLLVGVGGLAVAKVDARRRRSEFAFLRAIGTPRSTVRSWFLLESLATTGVALLGGALLALGLTAAVVPDIATAAADVWVPVPRLALPWSALAPIAVVASALVLVPPLLTDRWLEHEDTAALIRAGEET